MNKKDNKGFTLVELLISVTILAIVIIPVLHSFVSSYRINAISRETLRGTTLAQNEMEIFEKEKIKDLTDGEKFSYEVKENANGITGAYQFIKKEVINDDSGRKLFDVYVTLNPDGEYAAKNEKELAYMDNMGLTGSGRFVQPTRTKYKHESLDESMYRQFKMLAYRNGNEIEEDKEEDFEKNIKRTITLKIFKDGLATKAKVTYEYECDKTLVGDGNEKVTKEFQIYDNSTLKDEKGKLIELQSLYFFYAPRYLNNKDVIIVENTAELPVNVNIIRMEVLKRNSNDYDPVPSNYSPTLVIKDAAKKGNYLTNLNIDGTAAGVVKGGLASVKTDITGGNLDSAAMEEYHVKHIGNKEARNRIYNMKVEVYKTGSTYGVDDPVITLTGTKME